MRIEKIYSVEVSGACNLEATCKWCPMHRRPRHRQRGLIAPSTVKRCLELVEQYGVTDVLALHNFGEPLLHPKFDEIAYAFAQLVPVTVSTNGVLLDERWADRLAKIPWAWISISPWDATATARALRLLSERNIHTQVPPGVSHNWAGQAAEGGTLKFLPQCRFLQKGLAVIRWDGSIATCCITDREGDAWGSIFDDRLPSLKGYDLCEKCHHNLS